MTVPNQPDSDAAVPRLWRRIVQSDGPWTHVAWSCPGCSCFLWRHYLSGGCGACDCPLSYPEAERQAWKAAKDLVGAP